jgi:hypothetical protein
LLDSSTSSSKSCFFQNFAADDQSLKNNRPKSSPATSLTRLMHINLYLWRNWRKKLRATCVIFKNPDQSKRLPIGRKFAQSGHPAADALFRAYLHETWFSCRKQGCQIFRGATYHNGENIPNDHKKYKLVIKITEGRKIFKIAKTKINIFHSKAHQSYPHWDFWYENIPSGNHGRKMLYVCMYGTMRPWLCLNWFKVANTIVHRIVCEYNSSVHCMRIQ